MRLALLIVVAVVILAGAAGSYYHYRTSRENRYDDLIVEVAARHVAIPDRVVTVEAVRLRLEYAR